MASPSLRAELAVIGVRVDAPVRRTGGAGPTGDGHLVLDGVPVAIPLDPSSPYVAAGGRLLLDGIDLGVELGAVERPRFYDLRTSDGVEMHRIARLHGAEVLASTVVQTCVRYEPSQRCRYCSIEESLASEATTRVKSPSQLAEVAAAAVELDGIRQVVLTTGTSATADRGARHLARCVAAIKGAVGDLPVQVQCEPPDPLGWIDALHDAGADAIGIHVESLDDAVRARWLPGKATVGLDTYWAAWDHAVAVFGANRVSTYLLVGLGEDPDDLVAGAARLIEHGVFPFVVPVRAGTGTLAAADGLRPPAAGVVTGVSARVEGLLSDAGMVGTDQRAGCAACGACSAVRSEAGTSPGRVALAAGGVRLALGRRGAA